MVFRWQECRLVGRNRFGIADDDIDDVRTLADADDLPVFVSPKFGEGQAIRHLHHLLILRGKGSAADHHKQYGASR
jgi:hypothetical protein